jgi:hypothetical protein
MIRLIRPLLCYSRQDSRKQASCRIAALTGAIMPSPNEPQNVVEKFRTVMRGRIMNDASAFLY